jgi:hypothetical protein
MCTLNPKWVEITSTHYCGQAETPWQAAGIVCTAGEMFLYARPGELHKRTWRFNGIDDGDPDPRTRLYQAIEVTFFQGKYVLAFMRESVFVNPYEDDIHPIVGEEF